MNTQSKPLATRKLRAARPRPRPDVIEDRPRSVYELMTRRMLEELREDVAEVKGRVSTLLWLVVGAVVLEVLTRLLG